MAREKNWQFVWNHSYTPSSGLDLTRYSLWFIAASLTGNFGGMTGSGLWSLYASSDSITAGTDSTDRWQLAGPYDGTKIVRGNGTAAHSWIVLRSPYVKDSYWYMTLSFNTSNDLYIKMAFSKSPPTNGSTTVTAYETNTHWPVFASSWGQYTGLEFIFSLGQYPWRYIVSLAEDGQFFFHGFKQGLVAMIQAIHFSPLSDSQPSDLYPIHTYATAGTPGSGYYPFYAGGNNIIQLDSVVGFGAYARYFTGDVGYCNPILSYTVYGQSAQIQIITGGANGTGLNLPAYVFTTAATSGNKLVRYRGRIADFFIASSLLSAGYSFTFPSTIPLNTTFPLDTVEYVSIGTVIIPAPAAIDFS